jgi:hypothetical protein
VHVYEVFSLATAIVMDLVNVDDTGVYNVSRAMFKNSSDLGLQHADLRGPDRSLVMPSSTLPVTDASLIQTFTQLAKQHTAVGV